MIMMINEIDDKCSKYIEMRKILIILIVEIYMKIQYICVVEYVVEYVSMMIYVVDMLMLIMII